MQKIPSDRRLKGLFMHIYIEDGQIECFYSYILGWGLRVIAKLSSSW